MDAAGLIEQGIEKLAADPIVGAPVGDELAALLGLRSRLDAQISRRVGALDTNLEWAADGCRSAAAWITKHSRCRHGRARRLVRQMPIVAEAWERGAIGTEHVDVLARTRNAARAPERFAEFEAAFTDVAEAGTPEDVEMVARQWRDALDAERRHEPDAAVRAHESRRLDLPEILDGVTGT
jgi:hypothetical protein